MSPPGPSFTDKQGQYLAFIDAYTRVNGRPPAESDMQRHFGVSPPSVHLYLGGRDQCLCKLIVRVGLSGATIRALVPRAPNVDLCPGRLATTDAQ